MILIKTFYAHNELRNYSYLVLDDQTGHSWVIDPYEALPLIDYIKKNGLVLKGILNTHQHFDHIRGNAPLMETFETSVRRLKDSETIPLGSGFEIQSIDTPGHTLDHQVFLWKKNNKALALFSGDTLFNSGVGNCKNGGDVNLLFETTLKLLELPEETLLYPGHDYRKRNLEFALNVEPENKEIREKLRFLEFAQTFDLPPETLKDEKKVNPFFRLSEKEIRQNILKDSSPLSDQDQSRRELFIQLRQLRDSW
jgi:hydroxyacylglutathione hydrolase